MKSERRNAANRANARHSTGPKTVSGKRAVRLNGLRHGVLSGDVILPGEDGKAFEVLRIAVYEDLAPCGPLEKFLTDRVVNTIWRLRRLERVETGLFQWHVSKREISRRSAKADSFVQFQSFPLLPLDTPTIVDEVAHADAKKALDSARAKQDRREVVLARTLVDDAAENDTFGKLYRYETTLERTLYKAIHELLRHQAARQGKAVPLPQAVDVDVAISERD